MAKEIDPTDADKKGKRTNAGFELKPKDLKRETHAPRGMEGIRGPGEVSRASRLPPAQDERAKASARAFAEAKQKQAERSADKADARDMVANGKQGRTTYFQKDFEKAAAPKPPSKLQRDFRQAASKDGHERGSK